MKKIYRIKKLVAAYSVIRLKNKDTENQLREMKILSKAKQEYSSIPI
jgi:hypothetical protein